MCSTILSGGGSIRKAQTFQINFTFTPTAQLGDSPMSFTLFEIDPNGVSTQLSLAYLRSGKRS